MRVIAGKFKGRRLVSPKKSYVRPTSDRVKESVFSIIKDVVPGSNFLDLFAGTGNIGIEALSRGAKQVTFIERKLKCLQMIEQNLKVCGLEKNHSQIQIIRADIIKGITSLHNQSESYELIYLDPPYDSKQYMNYVLHISDQGILEPNGIILVEHYKRVNLQKQIGNLFCDRRKNYGETSISFFCQHSI